MWGLFILPRGVVLRRSLFIFLAFGLTPLSAEVPTRYDQLTKVKAMIEAALDRVRLGQDACHDRLCQNQKRALLAKLKIELDWLPEWAEDSLLRKSFHSAYRLVSQPYEKPQKTDLLAWWKRRYQYELEVRSYWPHFVESLADLSKSLSELEKLKSEEPRPLWEHYWKENLFKAAQDLHLAVRLTREASFKELEGQFEEAETIREQAQTYFDSLHRFEEKQGLRISRIFQKLAPKARAAEALQMILQIGRWAQWFGTEDIFNEEFLSFVGSQSSHIRSLYRLAQDFNDLEYGVVGLKQVNGVYLPLENLQSEIEIQSLLDRFEEGIKMGIDTGVFFLLAGSANAIAAGSRILTFGILAPSLYAQTKWQWNLSASLFTPQDYTDELRLHEFQLEEMLALRRSSLQQTERALLDRLDRVNRELETYERNLYASMP